MTGNHRESSVRSAANVGRSDGELCRTAGADASAVAALRRKWPLRLAAAALVLCLAAWGMSMVYGIGLHCIEWQWTWRGERARFRFMAYLADGRFHFIDLTHNNGDPGGDEPWFYTIRANGELGLSPPSVARTALCHDLTQIDLQIELPLWLPAMLLTAACFALCNRNASIAGPGHCRTCGYNLAGNVSGRCPECGEPVGLQA